MSACPLGKCDGSGKISYVHREAEDTARPIPGTDLYLGPVTSYGSRLCACRRDLEPREGDARWWETERVFTEVFTEDIFQNAIEVTVDAEVPISEDNYRVVMRGNRYYPTMVDIEAPSRVLLHADAARRLGELLIRAADKCDEIDQPCAAECGHWHPCDCNKEERILA